jgi:hypothetical protein
MNVLTTTWRQLVRRRLWPVAVLLVAALAAVPVLLARNPDPVAPLADPVPASAAQAGDEIAEPVVVMAEAGDRDRRRRVLGGRKDPFEPAPPPKAKKADEDDADTVKPGDDSSTGGQTAPSDPVDPGFGTPPYGGTPVVPTPVEPKPKPKVYPPDSLIVRFGDAESGSLERSVLRKLEALPSADEPLVVYLGLTKDDKKAIFLVDESLEATGDGACKPHPRTCEEIHLRKGETEFFDLIDPESGEVTAQHQLDLVDIKRRAAKAKKSKAAKVAAGT